MALFLRIVRHLLPRAVAFRLRVGQAITRFFEGLVSLPAAIAEEIDAVLLDLFPRTTRRAAEWLEQFGIAVPATDGAQRAALTGVWQGTGGQSPRYIEDVVQAAGFPLYVHEWWEPSGPPWTARNPLLHSPQPYGGTVQCGEAIAQCGEPQAQANHLLASEIHYLTNSDLTLRLPRPMPDDPLTWRNWLYLGGETFGARVQLDTAQRRTLELLLYRLCPTHLWVMMLVEWWDPSRRGRAVLAQWLHGSKGVVLDADGSVAEWSDLSGHGRHLLQADPALRPSSDGSAIVFSGAQWMDAIAASLLIAAGEPLTVYCVWRAEPGDGSGQGLYGPAAGSAPGAELVVTDAMVRASNDGSQSVEASGDYRGALHVSAHVNDGLTLSLFLDDMLSPVASGPSPSSGYQTLRIGSSAALGLSLIGRIEHLIVLRHADALLERAQMARWLLAQNPALPIVASP